MNLDRTFTYEKETKNTFRFREVGEPEDHAIGTLYVKKSVLESVDEDAVLELQLRLAEKG